MQNFVFPNYEACYLKIYTSLETCFVTHFSMTHHVFFTAQPWIKTCSKTCYNLKHTRS